jgi:hypothetical protein
MDGRVMVHLGTKGGASAVLRATSLACEFNQSSILSKVDNRFADVMKNKSPQ